jgi:hypothetical protein
MRKLRSPGVAMRIRSAVLPSLALLLGGLSPTHAVAQCLPAGSAVAGPTWVVPAPELAVSAPIPACQGLVQAYLSRGLAPVATAAPMPAPVAAVVPAPAVAQPVASAAASPAPSPGSAYANDNRFNMIQNGQRMTAEDFEAWMRARGIRIVPPAPEAPTAAGTTAPANTAEGGTR